MWELIKMLKKIEGKFMFTHYENKFLDSAFAGWTTKRSIVVKKTSGAIEDGKKPKVVETIYCNYDIQV